MSGAMKGRGRRITRDTMIWPGITKRLCTLTSLSGVWEWERLFRQSLCMPHVSSCLQHAQNMLAGIPADAHADRRFSCLLIVAFRCKERMLLY